MTDQIKSRVIGNLGHITLNRPKALNALTHEMCEDITRLLVAWEKDSNIGAVVIDGAGDRAFCAGGDVIMLHDSGKAGDDRAEAFWRLEYALNELIYRYSKPYITLIDGFVMGGGVGLSVHGRIRVAGDNTIFAMPETGIGYFPDVGGTGALIEALGEAELDGSDSAVANVIMNFVKAPPKAEALPAAISAFGEKSVPAILRALDADGSEWAQKQAATLRKKSPLATCTTFEALRRGEGLAFREAMRQELDLSLNFLKTQDFYEGIRAQLIDKDRNPKWSHDSVDDVTVAQVQRNFQTAANPPQAFLA